MATEKQKTEQEKQRYLKIPYSILNIGGLGLSEKVLLAYISGFGKSGCWQNNATIAKVFFTNTRQIQYWIKRIHNYITVKCPRGYFRTMWAKNNPDVIEGVKEWQRKQNERRAKRLPKKTCSSMPNPAQSCKESSNAAPREILHTECAKSCTHSMLNPAVEPREILHTIKNHIRKEITKDITAPPAPLPAKGQSSAVLDDRKEQNAEGIQKFVKNFGRKKPVAPMSDDKFAERRNSQLRALQASK